MANRITTLFDLDAKGFDAGLKNLRTKIAETDSTFGKLKVGASGVFDTIKANAGAAALGAGAALAAFGAKAIGAFTDTAKAAIDGAAATGLNTEQMSRWIAVGDDFQISADQLVTGLGKIGKTLDSGKWEKYGVATRDAGGHARDVNDVLLDSLDMLGKIGNETERERVGNDLFGKSYANIAPLVGKTRAEYEKYLWSVEKGQVITEQEAKKAEKTRLAYDNLHDTLNEVTLALGQSLAPAAAAAADELATDVEITQELIDKLEDLVDVIPHAGGAVG